MVIVQVDEMPKALLHLPVAREVQYSKPIIKMPLPKDCRLEVHEMHSEVANMSCLIRKPNTAAGIGQHRVSFTSAPRTRRSGVNCFSVPRARRNPSFGPLPSQIARSSMAYLKP